MSFQRRALTKGQSFQCTTPIAAVFVHDGSVDSKGQPFETGVLTQAEQITAKDPATILIFSVSDKPTLPDAKLVHVSLPFLLRLDEVVFPPGAVAYRHVHPGPGFRHLRRGQLNLEADDHTFVAHPESTWFEPAHAPVRATASMSEPETAFVRSMLLPPDYAGLPTISILDPEDAARPKKQTTHRYVDHLVAHWPQVDAG